MYSLEQLIYWKVAIYEGSLLYEKNGDYIIEKIDGSLIEIKKNKFYIGEIVALEKEDSVGRRPVKFGTVNHIYFKEGVWTYHVEEVAINGQVLGINYRREDGIFKINFDNGGWGTKYLVDRFIIKNKIKEYQDGWILPLKG